MSDTAIQPDAEAVLATQQPSQAIQTDGVQTTGDDLSPLVRRGLLLTVISLGFYRFWYRTDLRRWYWRNTIVGDHALEYRGTARELFIGFLIALAVVLPLYFSGSIIALFASDRLGNVISGFSGLIFAILVQYGAFRSRRYRMTRTFWRGVRFDQKGSAWRYAVLSILWLLASVISLGLLFPVMRRALERYRINNTWFGSVHGVFEVPLKPVMKRWLVIWGLSLVMLGYGVTSIASIWLPNAMGMQKVVGLPAFIMILAVLMPFLLWPYYRAAEFRTFTNGTRIGGVCFESKLSTRAYYFFFLKMIGIFILFLICLFFVAMGVLALVATSSWYITGFADLPPSMAATKAMMVTGGIILVYLGVFLIFSYVKETVLNQSFWRHTAQTLTIINLANADTVLAQTISDESATGEGLGDAFDFGGV